MTMQRIVCRFSCGAASAVATKLVLVFNQVVQIQESIGPGAYTFRNRKTGERFGLKDLNPEAGRHKVELPSCSFICEEVDDELQGF
jgi:hypothetical protein